MLTKSSGNLVLQPYEKGWNGAVTANKSTIPNAEGIPLFLETVFMEKFCFNTGFNERRTATLISGKPL